MKAKSEKNVLIVVRQPVGGIRTYLTYVLSYPAFFDYRFTFLLPDTEEAHILKEDMNGIKGEFLFVKDRGVFGGLLFASSRALITGRYLLVHSHGFTSGVAVSCAAWILRVPHLLTVHDVLREAQFAGFLGMFKKWILRVCLNRIDTIQSVTRDAETNLLNSIPSLDRNNHKKVIINNGVDLVRFEATTARDLRTELKLSSDTVIAGFFGRFMAQKGFDTIIKAVQLLSKENITHKDIVIVTTSNGGFIREDFERIVKMNLGRYFRVIDFMPNIASVLQCIDMLLMPSRWEAAGILAMEAMCLGVPVIGTKCIGLREVLENTPSLQIDPEDARALADGIRILLDADRRIPARKFADKAKERFDIAKTADQVSRLYKSMLCRSV